MGVMDEDGRGSGGPDAPRGEGFGVEVVGSLPDSGLACWLVEKAERAGGVLGASGAVRVRVVDDAEMSAAHLEFCDVPGTTDVLTFDLTDPEGSPVVGPAARVGVDGRVEVLRRYPVDADVLVCLDEARRQASARGHDERRELLLYVVHAMLHCLGFDDHEESDAGAMHAMEDAVLSAIGVGPVYAGGRS